MIAVRHVLYALVTHEPQDPVRCVSPHLWRDTRHNTGELHLRSARSEGLPVARCRSCMEHKANRIEVLIYAATKEGCVWCTAQSR